MDYMIWFTASDMNSASKVKKYLYLEETSWKKIIPNAQISFLLSVSRNFLILKQNDLAINPSKLSHIAKTALHEYKNRI